MSVLDGFRLDDRVAVVTGASSGLGVAFATALAEAGADVVLAARRTTELGAVAEEIGKSTGRQALAVTVDIADPEQCTRLINAAVEQLGRVDILVNNAGVGTAVSAMKETPEQFRSVIDTNLNGTYWLCQAAARQMGAGATIINIASVLGITTAGLPQAAYSASKAAVIGLTRDLAQQWAARRGIRVNAIAPGYVETEMTSVYDESKLENFAQRTVIKRLGTPNEIAATLVWLASDAASYVHGQTICVDGGFTIT
ncbi:short-chain dehydrogenase [Mycobacterium sp. Root265]|uniref:SDR family NAD(P)-dependent oxidoreductase n=1 Tax=Mycobacterium sp. Root265 TaxID=1736504 RepID=UPI000710E961|nr:3-oxoacyl-ACP reductase family protein [Mycobacterium sp. Root265]KRD05761.1 short-chain dehydrogenase [Mycobacterium sp. Root265]